MYDTKWRLVTPAFGAFSSFLIFILFTENVVGFGEIYCGSRNCYDVLQVTRDDDRNTIRRSYRRLALQIHPDKQNTDAAKAEAEEQMKLLNIAYEILTDADQRLEYDYMLDNPDEMYYNYYQYYRRRYAPKVDVRLVIAAILILVSSIQYVGQWTSYREALSYLSRDPKHRSKAREIAQSEGLLNIRKKENGKRYTREELKEREEEVLRTIIMNTVDLRGDFKKPSLRRVPIVRLFILPYSLFQWCRWAVRWVIDYWILRKPYDAEAKDYLTRRRLGMNADQWEGLEETRKQSYLRLALWVPANFKSYSERKAEEIRVQAAENSQQKRYRRYVKRAGGPPQMGMEDMDL
ncbi:DnaJ dnj-2 (DnaJ domain protein 2) [Fasciola gigantica]|uniref:DnaJ dnj-2 (DnaJ domain protein 2) n=1 Tax=Fasciola gigantica TaxID=46835 RepID=A0A504YHP7_FASGI|nr:DnaJ dnj-2 (DnaJ domain protein 2) [Fasciola gigantica]